MQWCSEEISEDSDAEPALITSGTPRRGMVNTASVSPRVLAFLERPSQRPLFVSACSLL